MLVLFIVGLCSVSGRVEFTSGVATHPRFVVHLRGCFFFYGVGFTTGGGNFPRCGIHLRGWKFFTICCSPPGAVFFLFRMVFTSGCVFVVAGMY